MRSQSLTLRSLLAMASMGLASGATGAVAHASNPRRTRDIPMTPPQSGGFIQHTNPGSAARRRAIKAAGGIRQFKRQRQAAARDRSWSEIAD